jgi:hypothetical protein
MAHKHWPEGHPFYPQAPTCPLTIKACDKLWTAYLHFHEGQPCETMSFPNYKRPKCIVGMTPEEIEAKLSETVKKGKAPADEVDEG